MHQPSEVRQSYIECLEFRNTIAQAIQDSSTTALQQEGFKRWASPKILRDSTGKLTRQYSEKFLAYCANPAYAQYTAGKTPTQISLEKINSANAVIQQEALNRQALRSDLALQEALLTDLRLKLPPTEQLMSLDELKLLQAGADSPRYDDSGAARHRTAEDTETAALEAAEAAIDKALTS